MSGNQVRGTRVWLVVCISVLVAGSFLPLAWKIRLGTHGPFHLRIHFAAFTICGLVANASACSLATRAMRGAGLVLVAFALEAIQWRFFLTFFEWRDVAADTAGVMAALLLIQVLTSLTGTIPRR